MVVPKLESAHESPHESRSLNIECDNCQRELLVPASAKGKAVACRCGKLVLVRERPQQQQLPTESLTDFLGRLGPVPEHQHSTVAAGPEFWYIEYDRPDIIVEGQFEHATSKQVAEDYLRRADVELRLQRRNYNRAMVEGSMDIAQQILMVVGLLIILYNGYRFYTAGEEAEALMSGQTKPLLSQEALVGYLLMFYGIRILLGFFMMFLGALAKMFPRFCSTLGLMMHLVPNTLVLFLLLAVDPMLITQGFTGWVGLVRVVANIAILIALTKAVIDGFTYQS